MSLLATDLDLTLRLKNVMEDRHSSSASYNINYHFVWCPKYRKPILVGDVAVFLTKLIREIAEWHKWIVLELKVLPDHVHLFLQCNLTDSPVKIIKTVKWVTGLQLFRHFPELRQKLWKGVLWSPSYYVGMQDMCRRRQ